MLDQRQPIVAEEHRTVDEYRRRAETSALDQFVGVVSELVLVFGIVDLLKKFALFETNLLHDRTQLRILADIPIRSPIRLKHSPRVFRYLAVFQRDERATHRL